MLSGQYDARARVLIRHVGCLLRTSPRRLEEFEETLGESLREAVEESEYGSSPQLRRTFHHSSGLTLRPALPLQGGVHEAAETRKRAEAEALPPHRPGHSGWGDRDR